MTLGGRTIAEWQAAMTHGEWDVWMRYRRRHGPMGLERRYDRPAALIAALGNNTMGGKLKMSDLSPWPLKEAIENEADALIAEMMGESD